MGKLRHVEQIAGDAGHDLAHLGFVVIGKGQLLQVIQGNIDLVCDFVRRELPGVTVSPPQSTYLVFLCCDEYVALSGRSMDEIINAAWDVGVGLQDGRPFFEPCGLRLNLALPKSRVEEALRRLKEHVFV